MKQAVFYTYLNIKEQEKKWKNTHLFISFLKLLYICIGSTLQLAHYAVTVTSYRGFKNT